MPYPIATATGNWHFFSLSATAESIAPDSIAVDSSWRAQALCFSFTAWLTSSDD